MGQPVEVICKTCKTEFYLGYGGAKFQEEVAKPRFKKELHEGHDFSFECSDYQRRIGDDLWGCHPWYSDAEMVAEMPDWKIATDYYKEGVWRFINLSGEDLKGYERPDKLLEREHE